MPPKKTMINWVTTKVGPTALDNPNEALQEAINNAPPLLSTPLKKGELAHFVLDGIHLFFGDGGPLVKMIQTNVGGFTAADTRRYAVLLFSKLYLQAYRKLVVAYVDYVEKLLTADGIEETLRQRAKQVVGPYVDIIDAWDMFDHTHVAAERQAATDAWDMFEEEVNQAVPNTRYTWPVDSVQFELGGPVTPISGNPYSDFSSPGVMGGHFYERQNFFALMAESDNKQLIAPKYGTPYTPSRLSRFSNDDDDLGNQAGGTFAKRERDPILRRPAAKAAPASTTHLKASGSFAPLSADYPKGQITAAIKDHLTTPIRAYAGKRVPKQFVSDIIAQFQEKLQ